MNPNCSFEPHESCYSKQPSLSFLLSSCRDREERLAALTAAQQEAMEELQKKIQLKVGTVYILIWNFRAFSGALD